jgi:hypothetical protein
LRCLGPIRRRLHAGQATPSRSPATAAEVAAHAATVGFERGGDRMLSAASNRPAVPPIRVTCSPELPKPARAPSPAVHAFYPLAASVPFDAVSRTAAAVRSRRIAPAITAARASAAPWAAAAAAMPTVPRARSATCRSFAASAPPSIALWCACQSRRPAGPESGGRGRRGPAVARACVLAHISGPVASAAYVV